MTQYLVLALSSDSDCWYVPVTARPLPTREEAQAWMDHWCEPFSQRKRDRYAIFEVTQVPA